MPRSVWKGPYVQKNLKKKKSYPSWCRATTILPAFIGKKFKIYNGHFFFFFKVTSFMVGSKLGDFAFTRKRFLYKKKR